MSLRDELIKLSTLGPYEIPCTLFGQRMAQRFVSLYYWEALLLNTEFSRIVELGTAGGGLSFYLFLWCRQRQAKFYTFEINDTEESILKTELGFKECFRQRDIFKSVEEIKGLIQEPGLTVLFCDNGDKPKEFRIFQEFLKRGDIIGVHDWGNEIIYDDTNRYKDLEEITFVNSKDCDSSKTLVKFFRKV